MAIKILPIPDWFRVHRFQSAADLVAQDSLLDIVCSADSASIAKASDEIFELQQQLDAEDFGIIHGQIANQKKPSQNRSAESTNRYQIDEATYAAVKALYGQEETIQSTPNSRRTFRSFPNDVVLLNFSNQHHPGGGLHFLEAIVERFAKDVKADLVTLDVEDIKDIQQHVLSWTRKWNDPKSEQEAEDPNSLPLDGFPFAQLLSLPRQTTRTTMLHTDETPLVLHLLEVSNVVEIHGLPFLRKLGKVVSWKRRYRPVIVFLTTARSSSVPINDFAASTCPCGSCEGDFPPQLVTELGKAIFHTRRRDHPFAEFDIHRQAEILKAVGQNSQEVSIRVAPLRNAIQAALLDKHRKIEESWMEYNVRGLKRCLRYRSNKHHRRNMLQPFVSWQFMDGTDLQKSWADHPIQLQDVAVQLSDSFSDGELAESILQLKVSQMNNANDKTTAGAQISSKRRPRRSKSHIQSSIKNTCDSRERDLLDCVVYPEDSQEGWAEIAVDLHVKDTMMRILNLNSSDAAPNYGLMRDNGTRGALLYGPPGTGKTHLARVLARESGATLLSVSAGQLFSMWHGESEHNIVALFSLARKIAPTIIFIDEADAIFTRRGSSASTSNHSERVVNQLLQEMDSIRRSKDAPFMLLATNCPDNFDFAVYRRVPSRVYMGLPTQELRLQLLQILLRDEILDASVELEHLASLLSGFSGSDLKNICVQVAQACDSWVSPRDRRRLINWSHFETCLRSAASSVTASSLVRMKGFAAEYDPSALAKIKQDMDTLTVIADVADGVQAKHQGATVRPKFHRPDFEQHRPTLKNIDLTAMPLQHETMDCDRWTTDPNYEPESARAKSKDGPSDTPLTYQPLDPNTNQVRILCILPKDRDTTSSRDEILHCSMEVVSLEDWTDTYRAFISWMETQSLPSTPKYRHALWALKGACSYADFQMRQGEADGVETSDAIDWTESRLSDDNDWRLRPEDAAAIAPRFVWGDYVALSYVWGDATKRRNIIVNGHTLSVTSNLYDALISLRDSEEISQRKLHVWIDAICINQEDLAERACEVQKMSMIYSECLAVRGWLGQPDDPAGAAIASQIRHFLDATVQVDPKRCTWQMLESFIEPDALVEGAHMLLTQPFWKRLWIVQELALAPSLHFKLGGEQFITRDLLRLAGWCVDSPLSQRGSPDLSRPVLRLSRLRRWNEHTDVTSNSRGLLIETVRLAQTSMASDPRDKLYGLLALLPVEVRNCIRPDYSASITTMDIFAQFSQICFRSIGNLDLLARRENVESQSVMPTWALDLDCSVEECDPRGISMDVNRHRKYRANERMNPLPFHFTNHNQQLRCQGVVIDTVLSLADKSEGSKFNAEMARTRESQAAAASKNPSSAYTDPALALSRVLMTDEDFEFESGHPSIQDIPWLSPASLEHSGSDANTWRNSPGDQDLLSLSLPVAWPELYHRTGLAAVFSSHLHPNTNFDVGGQPLWSYFASPDKLDVCQNSGAYRALLWTMSANLSRDRIVSTSHGRVGLVPKLTEPGDKIAVLCNCDKPIILRPVGRSFEIVGSCFIEGLMKGETVDLIEDSKYNLQIEEIALQ